jgi:hypothetical protein
MQPVSRQRIGKHVLAATNTHATTELLQETVFATRSVQRGYKKDKLGRCGCGVEYLYRDPASRRRRQNGKSQI